MERYDLSLDELTQLTSSQEPPQEPSSLRALLRDFFQLTDAQLRARYEREEGRFIVESLTLLEGALELGLRPLSVLTGAKWAPHVEALAERFPDQLNTTTLLVAPPEVLKQLTGYQLHRGTLASFARPAEREVREVLQGQRVVVVLEDLVDHANMGAICRSVVGLGAGALLLTPRCADPLYRRSLRVSMGAALRTPWARAQSLSALCDELRAEGFTIVALALNKQSERLKRFAHIPPERVAFLLGSEGKGLSDEALAQADRSVYIEMSAGVESLNVASAAAVAMWALS